MIASDWCSRRKAKNSARNYTSQFNITELITRNQKRYWNESCRFWKNTVDSIERYLNIATFSPLTDELGPKQKNSPTSLRNTCHPISLQLKVLLGWELQILKERIKFYKKVPYCRYILSTNWCSRGKAKNSATKPFCIWRCRVQWRLVYTINTHLILIHILDFAHENTFNCV